MKILLVLQVVSVAAIFLFTHCDADLDYDIVKFKSCKQSSDYTSHVKCELAMDGKYHEKDCSVNFSHTNKDKMAWWSGTLEWKTNISQVWIMGRKSKKTYKRLNNFKVLLDKGKVCAKYNFPTPVEDKVFECAGISKTVTIQLSGTNYLTLCQVTVIGQPVEFKIIMKTTERRELKPGWVLIQQRETPGLDFNKEWNDYKNGFAYTPKDFWLGLEKIYNITKSGAYGLRLEFETHKNYRTVRQWKHFKIGNEAEKYKLDISGFDLSLLVNNDNKIDYMSWTAGEFFTVDRDNSVSCAIKFGGGWWMRADVNDDSCFSVHFNNDLSSRLGYSKSCVHYRGIKHHTPEKYNECLKKVRMILIKH